MGGFVAIFSIFMVSQQIVGTYAGVLVVASMGASAVLLFAVPHGPLSQPWPVFAGHMVSAFIGVTCAALIPSQIFAASLAVGIAIGGMYYLRCIHPPGGATALSAVIGGETVHTLGYQYMITPVLVNVIIIIFIAFAFNYWFPWRRYPTFLHQQKLPATPLQQVESMSHIRHEDFVYALSEIDSYIDISERDLLRIYDIATRKTQEPCLARERIVIGRFFSNGEYGSDWSVREIVDESINDDKSKHIVVYKVVAGRNRRSSGYSTRNDFLRWAKHEVILEDENWKRVSE